MPSLRLAHGWLLLTCTLASCVRQEELWITGGEKAPLPPGTRSVVLGASSVAGTLELYALEPPFALSVVRDPEARLIAQAFDRDLAALDLTVGRLAEIPGSGGRPAPTPLATYVAEAGRAFAPALTGPDLVFPPHDWSAILSAGRCGEGLHYIGSTCGSTVAFALSPPERPRLRDEGQCPPGWAPKPYAISNAGAAPIEVCEPPPRLSCAPGTQQGAGDAQCRPIGDPCPSAGPFPPGRSTTSTTVFVLAGAAGPADGSREHPYATLREGSAEAERRGARALVLGRGSYAEGLSLSGTVDVVGACSAETIIQGTLTLTAHRGRVANLSVAARDVAPLVVERGSHSALEGVQITASSSISDDSHVFDSALAVLGSALLLPDAGRWGLHGARLSLTDSTYRGQLHGDSSELSVVRSAIIGTGGPITASNSTVSVDQSYVAIPLHSLNGRLEVRRSWLLGTAIAELAHQRSIYAQGGALLVSKVTIDHRRGIVSVPQAFPGQAQIGLDVHAAVAPAQLSDLLVLMPPQAVDPPAIVSMGIALFDASPAPHRVERTIVQDASYAGFFLQDARANLSDVEIHRSTNYGILGTLAELQATRVEITECLGGGLAMKDGSASLSDLGIIAPRIVGLVVQGDGPFVGSRLRVVSERAAGIAVRAEEASKNPVNLVLRELDVEGPFAAGLQLGSGTGVQLTHFRIDGVSLGADLVGRSEHRSLSKGTIRAEETGLNVAAELGELAPLLEAVGVTAPRPIERSED